MFSKIFPVFIGAAFSALFILSVTCEEEKICPFLAACIKETDGKVKIEDMKILMTAKEEDLDGISDDILCVSKCALEKRQIVVKEKIDTEKLAADKMIMSKIENKDEYLECMKKIEKIKECADIKEFVKCNIKFTKSK